jgi:esterase FrsA
MYTYPISADAMFTDRAHQFVGFGVPQADVAAARAAITDMWATGQGGWTFEWSRIAARYAAAGDHALAALVYGCAKFPCLADEQRVVALGRQREEYLAAAPAFPVPFERRVLTVPYRGAVAEVPVHLYGPPTADRPVLLLGGGVDTWKMDIHPMCVAAAQSTGATVLAFDMPGTGEIVHLPLDAAADEVVLGVAAAAKEIGNGTVGHLAISFGANFSAMTGLTGAVDAAVDDGGPVKDAFTREHLANLPYGMAHIVGNAMGFDRVPDLDDLLAAAAPLSRETLLDEPDGNAAMLVVNGADDYFVPQSDTLAFQGRPRTEVHLIPGTGHVAMSRMAEVMPMMLGWMRTHLRAGPGVTSASSAAPTPHHRDRADT